MRSSVRIAGIALAVAVTTPTPAYAADGLTSVPDWLSLAAGAVSLLTAIIMLVDAVLLRRVAEGSVVADNIAYMMTGVVCVGLSVLFRWISMFVDPGLPADQTAFAADLLLTAAMALLAVYFLRIRLALVRYLHVAEAMTHEGQTLDAQSDDVEDGDRA